MRNLFASSVFVKLFSGMKRVKGKPGNCLDVESLEKCSLVPASHIFPDTENKVVR
jgi:hypothetical protein